MTSKRKRKKTAAALGLSERELMMAEMVEELLDHVRWLSILGYGNQYMLKRHLKLDPAEQDRVLEAATRAVDQDAKLHEWRERLARLKGEVVQLERRMSDAEGADAG